MSAPRTVASDLRAILLMLARLGAIVGLPVFFCMGCASCLGGKLEVALTAFGMLGLLALLGFANHLTRHVFIPLGWPRLAYHFTRAVNPLRAVGEGPATGLFVAIQAIRRRRSGREADLAWLRERLAADLGPIRNGWELLLAAEMLDLEGNRARARALYEAVFQLRGKHLLKGQSAPRDHASLWLHADAAERGDWDAVIATVPRIKRDNGAVETFPEAVAQLLHRESALDGSLLGAWLGEGASWATWPWVLRAMRVPTRPHPTVGKPTGDAFVDALHLHRYVLTLPASELRAPNLVALGEAWERVRADAAVEARIADRLAALEARASVDTVRARALACVEADLVAVVDRALVPIPAGLPPVVAAAVDVVWERRAAAVGDLMATLGRRLAAKEALSGPDEWVAWSALQAAWEAAVRVATPLRRRWLYDQHNVKLCNTGVWLSTGREEKFLAHAIFAFLLEEAETVGASEDFALFQKNVRVTK